MRLKKKQKPKKKKRPFVETSKAKLELLLEPRQGAQVRLTVPTPWASKTLPTWHPHLPSWPFSLRIHGTRCSSAGRGRGPAARLPWAMFCRLLDLCHPLSCPAASLAHLDLVLSWEASYPHSALRSSCWGQTPILCLGPWGRGPNTAHFFFSIINVLSGGVGSPSWDGRGTRQRRRWLFVLYLLQGGCLGPTGLAGG